jgi:hypothetical protein
MFIGLVVLLMTTDVRGDDSLRLDAREHIAAEPFPCPVGAQSTRVQSKLNSQRQREGCPYFFVSLSTLS